MSLVNDIKGLLSEEFITLEGSLGIPRDEMPQIDSEHIEPFLDYLKEIGCNTSEVQKEAHELKPSQAELDPAKADKIWSDGGTFKNPIFTSKDGYVLDGHHRWLAALRNADKEKMNCIELDLDAREAIEKMHEFEHTKVRGIDDKLIESLDRLLREDAEKLSSLTKEVLGELEIECAEFTRDWPDEVFTADLGETILDSRGKKISKEPVIHSIKILSPYDLLSQFLDNFDKQINTKDVKESDYATVFSGLIGNSYELQSSTDFKKEGGESEGSEDIFFTIKIISLKYNPRAGIIEVKFKESNFNL